MYIRSHELLLPFYTFWKNVFRILKKCLKTPLIVHYTCLAWKKTFFCIKVSSLSEMFFFKFTEKRFKCIFRAYFMIFLFCLIYTKKLILAYIIFHKNKEKYFLLNIVYIFMYLKSFLYHFKINIAKKVIILNSLVQVNLLILSKSYNLKFNRNDNY